MRSILISALLTPLIAFTTPLLAEVNFVSFGGAYSASQQKAYAATYREPDSINFINYNGGLGQIRTQVRSGNVTWDIVDVVSSEAQTGCDEGLFEKLDRGLFTPAAGGTPMDKDILIEVPNECAVPQVLWSYVPFFEEDRFAGAQPETIADFFDVEKFPGRRGIHTWPQALIEMALVADGVAIDDIYRVMDSAEGIDRAFRMLDRIKPHAVFWSSGAQPLELVKSGEVSMSIAFSGRVGTAVLSENENFVALWDGQVLEQAWLVLVKGAPNREAAIDFLVHASAPEQQAGQARYIPYGPMRHSALEIIRSGEPWFHNGKAVLSHLPNRPEVMSRTIVANPEWWSSYGDTLTERYNAWMAQ